MKRTLSALLSAFFFVQAVSPAWALRPMGSGSASGPRKEIVSSLTGLEEDGQPSLALLQSITQLARTLTGNYELTLVPWQSIGGGDWPQWRVMGATNRLQYVPADFQRFPGDGVVGLPLEAIAVASTFDPHQVEPEYQADGLFWALLTVFVIPRARALMTKKFSGTAADFGRLDAVIYLQHKISEVGQAEDGSVSAFLQFLAMALYEGRRSTGYREDSLPVVEQAFQKTREIRRNLSALDSGAFYQAVRDQLWPVAGKLLEYDMRQELFRAFQQEPEFRAGLGLSRRQKLLGWQGRLGLHQLNGRQAKQVELLLATRSESLSSVEQEAFRGRLLRRLKQGFLRMREQMSTGLLPPLAAEEEEGSVDLLEMQQRLFRQARTAVDLARQVAFRFSRLAEPQAGLEERFSPGLVRQLHQEMIGLAGQAQQAGAVVRSLADRIRALDLDDVEAASRILQLTEQLAAADQEIREQADRLAVDADQLSQRAQPGVFSTAEIQELAAQARQLLERASDLQNRLERLRDQADEAEMTAIELMTEGRMLQRENRSSDSVNQAIRSIARWADPGFQRRRATAEAFSQTLLRALRRIRRLQEESPVSSEQAGQVFREEMGRLSERAQRLMDRLGVPQELQQEWEERAMEMTVSDLADALGPIQMPAQKAPQPYRVAGTDLLKVVPPVAPGNAPSGEPTAAAPSSPESSLKPPPAAATDWKQNETQAWETHRQLQQWRRGIVGTQADLYRKYRNLRQGIISTAQTHLFQWARAASRRRVQTDLADGELDPDALALAKTGTPRLFMEEGKRAVGAKGRLSLLVDVSGSMLDPGNISERELKALPYSEQARIKTEALRNGTRRIDYVNDLLVTLGEAAGRKSALELQVTIFSDWEPNVSVVVKRFDEPWTEAKAAEVIDRVLNSHHSGTDDVRAVEEEILRIREGADSKGIKMIWVLSDGFSTDGGAAAMQELVRKNGDVRVFGWGLGPAMSAVKTTYGHYGIAVARMTDLDRQGMAVLNRELRRPVREWVKQEQAASAGLEEETTPKPRLAEDGWPVDFPRLHPIQDRPGAGPLQFHREGEQAWFEVDGIRIDPPAQPRVTLSDWAVQRLQQMWDVYRLHPRGRNNNLLLYGQAGIGKSLYLRYLWEIARGRYRAQAELLGSGREELKSRILEFADGTQTRVITFHENIRKSDLSERMHLGEQQAEEAGWTASDLVEGGVAGDQVVLSEVNRAPDEILSELDEPLADRQKTGFEGTRRFHPAARFAAAVNPAEGEVDYQIGYKGRPLSGQFLGHFSKIVMDYPRKTLPDGSDNPEWELFRQHERQVLQEVRRRKIGGEWAVSGLTLDQLLLLASLVREDAWAGQAPFIVTTRALVRMVEQLDRFPHLRRRMPDLFFRVYWADDAVHGEGTRGHLMALIERVFKPADWPPTQPWPGPREPAVLPRIVSEEVNGVRRELLTYPHWEPDVRIPLAPGTGAHIPEEVFLETDENLHRLEDLLMDVALRRNLMNMGDSDTGQSYFIRVLARILRRNLIVVRLSQDFKLRDVLVSRWYSAGRTGWRDSLPLTYQRAERVAQEGPPIILWDRGEKGDPGTLAGLNDLLQERRIRLASGEDFVLPEGTIIAVNRTPPRPPYDFFEHSAEFWDRFQHHGYAFPSAPQEMEIVRAHHPALPEGSVRQIVEGMNVLRRLYGGGEIFEPPGVVTTLAAAARLAQKSGPLPLPDLLLEAYSPLRSEERPGIRIALDQEGLGGEVHPTVDPSLGGMMQAHPNLRWSPEVQADPGLWRQAAVLSSDLIQQVTDSGQAVQIGWGLRLRRNADGNPEVAALSAGTDRPFELYAHLAESLREKVRERSGARFQINGNGIFFSQGSKEEDWIREPFEDSHWKGLRDFLRARGITGRKFVTFQLPPEEDAAWQDLGWLLDPVTLRRNLPVAGRFQGISDSIPLSVEEGRPLSRLAGYSVGFGMVDPADPARRLPPGFLIRAADAQAGLEEPELPPRRLPLLPPIGNIPVLAAFVNHGDDAISLRMLEQFERRLDAFLKKNPQVKDLIFVEELGGPVVAEFFRQEGVDVGRLLEADRTDPDGRDLVVRPAFDQMARVVLEGISDAWSQLHAGQTPKDIQGAWRRRLFELFHQKQQQDYRLHAVVEQPLFEPWWNFILYQDQMAGITLEDLSRPETYPQARRKIVDAIRLEQEQSNRPRDEFIVRRQLVLLLMEIFAEPDPEDLQDDPLEPEQVAVVMVRGRFHAARVEPLLRNHFARVEPVLGEELVPEVEPVATQRYEEALVRGGYQAGEAPSEVEALLDEDIARYLERHRAADVASSAGLEESVTEWVKKTLGVPGLPEQVARLIEQLAGEGKPASFSMEIKGIDTPVRLVPKVQGLPASEITLAEGFQVIAQEGVVPESVRAALQSRFGSVRDLLSLGSLASQLLEWKQGIASPAADRKPQALLLVDLETAEQLQEELSEIDPGWEIPIVIVGVREGALGTPEGSSVDPAAVLSYLSDLLAQATHRITDRLEGVLTLDAKHQSWFLSIGA